MWEDVVKPEGRKVIWKSGNAPNSAVEVAAKPVPKRGCSLANWRLSRSESARGDVFVTIRASSDAPYAELFANIERVAFKVDRVGRKLALIVATAAFGDAVYTVRPAHKKRQIEVTCARAITQMGLKPVRGTVELPVPTIEGNMLVFDLSEIVCDQVS